MIMYIMSSIRSARGTDIKTETSKEKEYLNKAKMIMLQQERRIFERESDLQAETKIKAAVIDELRIARNRISLLEQNANVLNEEQGELFNFLNNLGKSLSEEEKREYNKKNDLYVQQELEKIKRGEL